jgi:IclR family acetate operon transcriptional repressor
MTGEATPPGMLGTIHNAGLLLQALTRGPLYQQLTTLADQCGLTPPTVHRLLRSLIRLGLVTQNPNTFRYGLGPEVVRLSQSYLMRLPVTQALAPYLLELRTTTKATVQVALLAGGQVVYVDRVDGDHAEGPYRIAYRMHPAFETASGRVLLARAEADARRQATTHARPVLDGGAVDQVTVAHQHAWAREPYLVVDDPDWPDLVEVAVHVADQRGQTLAALSATDRRDCLAPDTLEQLIVPQLLRVASTVRQALS